MSLINLINLDNVNNEEKKIKVKKFEIPDGLLYVPNFLTLIEEHKLLQETNCRTWDTSMKRRVQHYGYKYNYVSRSLGPKIEPIPECYNFIIDRLMENNLIHERPNQLIINEYTTGQGISPHTDLHILRMKLYPSV